MRQADWLHENSGGMFVQWRCDLHDPCNEVPDDPGYCPQGCTYMMSKFTFYLFDKTTSISVTEKAELKWQVDSPDENNTCTCDNDCQHSIKPEEFKKLEEGLGKKDLSQFHFYLF